LSSWGCVLENTVHLNPSAFEVKDIMEAQRDKGT
jgi:hypothetical protein